MRYLKSFKTINESNDDIAAICQKYGIRNWSLNDDGSIDVNGDVYLNFSFMKLPLRFRNVHGNFNCGNNQLRSLEDCPLSVGGYFSCNYNNLTSLEGCPLSVGGDFYCQNNQIRDFLGIGRIYGDFHCQGNPIHKIWRLFRDITKIELLNDYDAIRGNTIILDRLNDFLEVIGRDPVNKVAGYKLI